MTLGTSDGPVAVCRLALEELYVDWFRTEIITTLSSAVWYLLSLDAAESSRDAQRLNITWNPAANLPSRTVSVSPARLEPRSNEDVTGTARVFGRGGERAVSGQAGVAFASIWCKGLKVH